MSKVKKMLERALEAKSNESNIERFCRDTERFIDYWGWNNIDQTDNDDDFLASLKQQKCLFTDIPKKYNQTADYLMSLAFTAYTQKQDEAGRVIIAVLNQWDLDYANG